MSKELRAPRELARRSNILIYRNFVAIYSSKRNLWSNTTLALSFSTCWIACEQKQKQIDRLENRNRKNHANVTDYGRRESVEKEESETDKRISGERGINENPNFSEGNGPDGYSVLISKRTWTGCLEIKIGYVNNSQMKTACRCTPQTPLVLSSSTQTIHLIGSPGKLQRDKFLECKRIPLRRLRDRINYEAEQRVKEQEHTKFDL